jgi:YD repeat-containing protein
MRAIRIPSLFVMLISLLWFGPAQHLRAQQSSKLSSARPGSGAYALGAAPAFADSGSHGIREVIDDKYKKRYQEWKDEFVSTEIGRAQWEMYSHNPHFVLTIAVAKGNSHGAGSSKYTWDDSGQLTAATITLGTRINEGYPSSVYYPVMNALKLYESEKLLNGNVLAAAKFAHEFGHITKMAGTPEALYHLQVRLVPIYNKIFLSNGHNVNDPRLVDLAQQMGGNPVELWEDREYWGEANAMLYLRDRVAKESFHCRLFNKIKRGVEEYAKKYEERFTEIAKSQGVTYSCSWK